MLSKLKTLISDAYAHLSLPNVLLIAAIVKFGSADLSALTWPFTAVILLVLGSHGYQAWMDDKAGARETLEAEEIRELKSRLASAQEQALERHTF